MPRASPACVTARLTNGGRGHEGFSVVNLERVQALEAWLKSTNTKLTQVNGQRKYGGPPEVWDGPPPGARCEVFISQIPRDVYEDLLIPLFSSVGVLWEFRLMMNFSGQNRGFAYAKYGTAAIANDAIRQLHGYTLGPGTRLNVRCSIEKRHLCIQNLPASTQQEELLQVLGLLSAGVESVALKAGPGIEGVSAVVCFSSHHAASMAKKVLGEEFKKQFCLEISIKWLSAEKHIPDEPPPPQRAPKGLLMSPLKHLGQTSPRLPPRMVSPSIPTAFCRAVGGPATQYGPKCTSSPPRGQLMFSVSPVLLLQKLSEASGWGDPQYEMFFSHTGPDGFLYFTYNVHVPGAPKTFRGFVMILPGHCSSTVLEEAQRAAAQQVLQKVCSSALSV
ncbi:Dead end protein 1 [Oryzias melastigma]|uniref:Dead end protein 1 n=1 Tax=Oryzias melastigma TaxID=30732 RepID=A0A834CKF1_ORYME|nr:Dead end protein 1 [Oryzias melastigma]